MEWQKRLEKVDMEDCVNIKAEASFQEKTPEPILKEHISILRQKLQAQSACERIDELFSGTHAPPEPDHPNRGPAPPNGASAFNSSKNK